MKENITLSPRIQVENECNRYNFETPGKIQSHGAMLVLQEASLKIIQLSQNTGKILGIDHKVMINQPLSQFLDSGSLQILHRGLKSTSLSMINPLRLSFQGTACDAILLRHQDFLIVETEPIHTEKNNHEMYQMASMQAMEKFQNAVFIEQLIDIATNEIRDLIGFDRVMYYKFDEDYHGQVVAESTVRGVDSFLGLRFPASDIPSRVRQLYMSTASRYLPDLLEAQVPLFPEINPVTRTPLNMLPTILRAVAPTHIEYMKNLGINSSMSFPIKKDNKMIGMFACHHYSGTFVPYVNRLVCEQMVEMFVAMLTQLDDDTAHISRLGKFKENALEAFRSNQEQVAGNALLSMVNADGVAILRNNQLILNGYTPAQDEVRSLIQVLSNSSYNILYQEDPLGLFVTSHLSSIFDGAQKIKHAASGILAIPISKVIPEYIIWFRPERILAATWAGNPDQAIHIDEETMRVSPRKSFAAWQKDVENTSETWKSYEVQMAIELRNTLI